MMPNLSDNPVVWAASIVALWLFVAGCKVYDLRAAKKKTGEKK